MQFVYLYSCARKCDFCTFLLQKRDRRTKCRAAVSSYHIECSFVQIIPQQLCAAGVAQLAQRLCFDLAHPLPGHVELLAQFFQRAGTAILQTKAQSDDPLLPGF